MDLARRGDEPKRLSSEKRIGNLMCYWRDQRLKRRLCELISHPALIFRLFYSRHLGLILGFRVGECDLETPNRDLGEDLWVAFSSDVEVDVDQVHQFYIRNGWYLAREDIERWLSLGYDCMLGYNDQGRIVASQWFWYNEITLDKPRRCYFSKNDRIVLDSDTAYVCYELVDYPYRGRGIGQFMKRKFIERFKRDKTIKNLVLTTGASNSANIRAWMNTGARLIGIVEVRKILNLVIRRELFLDSKEKVWREAF